MEEIALAEEGVMKSTVDTKNTEAKTTELTRSETLKGIEDPATHANVPINLIQVPSVPLLTDEVHHSVAATAPAPANLPGTPVESPVAASFINTLLTTPSVSSTEVVQKKPAIDPYRETIE
jgi:biotin carboxyl carrier protein